MALKSGEATVRVKIDFEATFKSFSDLEKRQFPFAYALSLTKTAFAAREVARKRAAKLFSFHSNSSLNFVLNNIRIEPAKKSDLIKFGRAEAAVFTTDKIAFMTHHETGEDKSPRGRSLAIPSPEFFATPGVRGGSGAIVKRFKPKSLLVPIAKGRQGRKKGQRFPFIQNSLVLIRLGKARYPLRVLYGFESKAHIRPLWKFEEAVVFVAIHKFESIFKNAMEFAVKTAK